MNRVLSYGYLKDTAELYTTYSHRQQIVAAVPFQSTICMQFALFLASCYSCHKSQLKCQLTLY